MTDPAHAAPSRPEPVLDFAKLAAAVSGSVVAVGAAFVLIGWATADQVQQWAVIAGGIVTALGAVLAVVLPIFAAHAARAQVTPLANPQAVDGAPLVAAEKVSGADMAVSPSMGSEAAWAAPAFTDAATRDAKLASWVANGNTAFDGMICSVAGQMQIYRGGSWQLMGSDL